MAKEIGEIVAAATVFFQVCACTVTATAMQRATAEAELQACLQMSAPPGLQWPTPGSDEERQCIAANVEFCKSMALEASCGYDGVYVNRVIDGSNVDPRPLR